MTTRVIVGFDGSEHSRTALDWAAREAELRGASVHVITAVPVQPITSYHGIADGLLTPEQYDNVAEKYRRQAVDAVAKTIADHPMVGIDIDVVDEVPATIIVNEATADDLVVLGSSGAGAVKSFLLGSVVASVLRDCPCPVVVIPEQLRPSTGRIAVAVDGSPASDRALRWAAHEAELRSADLVVAHAWHYPYRVTDGGVGRRDDAAQVDAAIVLDRSIERARALTTAPIERRLVEGNTVQCLLDLCNDSDWIVVGSRGRGGFKSMVLGSVTQAVAKHATVPVVVVAAR